jgi:hypothetical protein
MRLLLVARPNLDMDDIETRRLSSPAYFLVQISANRTRLPRIAPDPAPPAIHFDIRLSTRHVLTNASMTASTRQAQCYPALGAQPSSFQMKPHRPTPAA